MHYQNLRGIQESSVLHILDLILHMGNCMEGEEAVLKIIANQLITTSLVFKN